MLQRNAAIMAPHMSPRNPQIMPSFVIIVSPPLVEHIGNCHKEYDPPDTGAKQEEDVDQYVFHRCLGTRHRRRPVCRKLRARMGSLQVVPHSKQWTHGYGFTRCLRTLSN